MASGAMVGRAFFRSAGIALSFSLPAMGAGASPAGEAATVEAEINATGLNTALDVPTRGVNVLLQNDLYTLTGKGLPEPVWVNSFSIQPLIPLPLGPMALYLRPYLPVRYRPIFAPNLGDEYRFGLGDSGLLAALVPFPRWPILVAIGTVSLFPTATSKDLSQEHFQLGPAAGAFYATRPWFLGFILQQFWSIGGSAPPVNQMDFQYYIIRAVSDHWQVGMDPDIFVDWNAPEGEQLTVPVGLGVWRSQILNDIPLRVGAEVMYSVIKPDFIGQEWTFRIQITPQIPYSRPERPAP